MQGGKNIDDPEVPALCRSCRARHGGLCGALTGAQLTELAKSTRKSHHQSGDILISSSTEVNSYANVMLGMVKLSKVLADGRQQIVGLQFAPDFLGRIFGDESEVTAEAAGMVDLCVLPRSTLEHLMAKYPTLERKLMGQTLRELDEARNWMVTLGRKTAQEKVASFLLLVATHFDPTVAASNTVSIDLAMKRADIADFLGLTIETVSRQFTKLHRSGVIIISKSRQITIPDIESLRRLAA